VTVRAKALTAIWGTLGLLTIVLFLLRVTSLLDDTAHADRQEISRSTGLALKLVAKELGDLDRVATDYSAWDDTYSFVASQDQAFIASNFVNSTFANNRLDLALIADLDGRPLYFESYDRAHDIPAPLTAEVLQTLTNGNSLLIHESVEKGTAGTWILDKRPILLASRPIIKSDSTGPIRGTLIFGRYLDAEILEGLSDLTGKAVDIVPLADSSVSVEMRADLSKAPPDKAIVDLPDSKTSVGLGLLCDGTSNPVCILRCQGARTDWSRFLNSAALVWGALLTGLLLSGLASLALLDILVFKRLSKLVTFVTEVEKSRDYSLRTDAGGADELLKLGEAFNSLCGSIQASIAERAEASLALQASEARLNALLQHSSDMLVLLAEDGTYLYVSPSSHRTVGYANELLLGNKPFKFIHPEDVGICEKRFAELVEKPGSTRSVEYRFRHANGTWRWLEAIGENLCNHPGIGAILLTVRDITERKQASQLLQESERRFRELLESTSLLTIILDNRGVIQFCNEALLSLTGWSEEDVLGQCYFQLLVAPEEQEDALRHYDSAIQETRNLADVERCIVTRDGARRRVVWDTTLLRDNEGRHVGMAAIGRDVTEHRRLEEQFRQAQKMEAVGQLAGGVAHDFNNLLQVISGYVEMTLSEMPRSDNAYAKLEEVQKATSRATTLVRQLLTFSRQDNAQLVSVDLNVVIANVVKLLRRVIGEHIALETFMSGDLPLIHGDVNQLDQVLMNLCVNASDAMPSGGTIRIETRVVDLEGVYTQAHPWATGGRYVLLEVADTGHGMTREVQEHIFEPFFTTKESGKGTGLGLATVYGIVKRHSGFIHVYSEVDKGTIFRVYLPANGDAPVSEQPDEKPLDTFVGGTETILLAEDDDQVRRLTSRLLQEAGYTVLLAKDGEEAVQLFEANKDTIALCLLDVVMPKKNGRAVYDSIMTTKPDTKVLFCSGYSYGMLAPEHLPDAQVEVIQKPYIPADLLRHVRNLLDSPAST